MATTTLGAEAAPHNLTVKLPSSIVLRTGAAEAPPALVAEIIEQLIAGLDDQDGDPDVELNGDELDGSNAEDEHFFGGAAGPIGLGFNGGPGCSIADPGEFAWPEWQSRGRHKNPQWRGTLPHEDAEDDDPDQGQDEGEPDMRGDVLGYGAGCPIADPGGCEHDGREPDDDAEREQMLDDVPAPLVFTLEPNLFTGKRECLGRDVPGAFIGTVERA